MIVAALLGLIVASSLWLAYFDFFSRGVERLVVGRRGEARIVLARDVYTYFHQPMVVGIVFFAYGDIAARKTPSSVCECGCRRSNARSCEAPASAAR